jgi:hypothetical protein
MIMGEASPQAVEAPATLKKSRLFIEVSHPSHPRAYNLRSGISTRLLSYPNHQPHKEQKNLRGFVEFRFRGSSL